MGGVGRDAQLGAASGFSKVRSIANLGLSMLERCFLNDEQRGGKWEGRECCIRLVSKLAGLNHLGW